MGQLTEYQSSGKKNKNGCSFSIQNLAGFRRAMRMKSEMRQFTQVGGPYKTMRVDTLYCGESLTIHLP
jgi:hypothetical protein